MNVPESNQADQSRMVWLDCLRLITGVSIVGVHAASDINGLPFLDFTASERVGPILFRSMVYLARTELFIIISLFLLCIAIEHQLLGFLVLVGLFAKRKIDVWIWDNLQDMDRFGYLVRFVKILTHVGYGFVAGAMYGLLRGNWNRAQSRVLGLAALYTGVLLYGLKLVYSYRVVLASNWQYNYTPAFWANFLMPVILFVGFMSLSTRSWPSVITRMAPFQLWHLPDASDFPRSDRNRCLWDAPGPRDFRSGQVYRRSCSSRICGDCDHKSTAVGLDCRHEPVAGRRTVVRIFETPKTGSSDSRVTHPHLPGKEYQHAITTNSIR
jgi:hypothetical protein